MFTHYIVLDTYSSDECLFLITTINIKKHPIDYFDALVTASRKIKYFK